MPAFTTPCPATTSDRCLYWGSALDNFYASYKVPDPKSSPKGRSLLKQNLGYCVLGSHNLVTYGIRPGYALLSPHPAPGLPQSR